MARKKVEEVVEAAAEAVVEAAVEAAAEEVAEAGEAKKATVCAHRENYVKGKTANGKSTMNNGDEVASALAELPLDDTYLVAGAMLNLTPEQLHDGYPGTPRVEKTDDEPAVPAVKAFKGYGHLNVGMQRMSLGNKIRGVVNKCPDGTQLAFLQSIVQPYRDAIIKAKVEAAEAETAEAEKYDGDDDGEGNAAD